MTVTILLYVMYMNLNENANNDGQVKEGYNVGSGSFCMTCDKKTINQCNQCANCGWCVDYWGNGKCIGGNHLGPFNKERCMVWKHNDPFSYGLRKNKADLANSNRKGCASTGL